MNLPKTKHFLKAGLQRLKDLILCGPLLSLWVRIKICKWQRRYLQNLTKIQTAVPKQQERPRNLRGRKNEKLRKILIICDEMWEKGQLLPELNTIASTQILDIKRVLKEDQIDLANMEMELARMSGKAKYGTVLLYLNSHWLSEDLFSAVRQKSAGPILGMNLDDKAEFFGFGPGAKKKCNYSQWVKKFDLNLSSSRLFESFYEKCGGRFYYCPPGLHIPNRLKAPKKTLFERTVSFLGSAKDERVRLVRALRHLGVKVDTFGKGWSGKQWVTSPQSVFRGTQINLGLGFASGSERLTSLKARDFECPGIGACYLTTYNFELSQHWELGEEVLCYRSLEELVEMIVYYQTKPEMCRKIARNAFRRAIAEHRWRDRFKKVFQEIGLKT